MKLFYLTVLDDTDRKKCGIYNKIQGQIDAFIKFNFEVSFCHMHGATEFVIEEANENKSLNCASGNTRKKLASVYDPIADYIISNGFENVYIRLTSLDRKAISFYKKLKKANVKIIIEFYSHNLVLERYKTAKRVLRQGKVVDAAKQVISLTLDSFYFKQLHKYIDLIVTTTPVGDLYGVKTINVVNGINVNGTSVRNKTPNEFDFNIISVAMISSWHGYDRVIRGISEYYKNGGTINIHYYVIGEGEEKSDLEKMVASLNLEEHVSFEGIKTGDELNPYYDVADVALEMLAGFRRTDGEISSIKMAEYFAKGVPVVYSSKRVDAYSDDINKYSYRLEYDESIANISEMISRITTIYKKDIDTTNSMHSIAGKEFSWKKNMEELIEYITRKGM